MDYVEPASPNTLPKYIKWLKKAVSKPYLYTYEEYAKIKKELYEANKLKKLLREQERSSQGFGYKKKPLKDFKVKEVETVEDVVDYTPGDDVKSVEVEVVEEFVNE